LFINYCLENNSPSIVKLIFSVPRESFSTWHWINTDFRHTNAADKNTAEKNHQFFVSQYAGHNFEQNYALTYCVWLIVPYHFKSQFESNLLLIQISSFIRISHSSFINVFIPKHKSRQNLRSFASQTQTREHKVYWRFMKIPNRDWKTSQVPFELQKATAISYEVIKSNYKEHL